MSEFDVEPIPGLPGLLPDGEELLWQGSPDWIALAKRALHVRAVVIYFGLLILLRMGLILVDGGGMALAVESGLWLAILALTAGGILSLVAWLYARSTIYSITSRRVVIRSGVVVPMAVNLPFKSIETAGLRVHPDGTGDIPLALIEDQKVNYLIMWPNVRPWHFSKAQPMLRALPNVDSAAQILAQALKAAADEDKPADAPAQPTGGEGADSAKLAAAPAPTESSDEADGNHSRSAAQLGGPALDGRSGL